MGISLESEDACVVVVSYIDEAISIQNYRTSFSFKEMQCESIQKPLSFSTILRFNVSPQVKNVVNKIGQILFVYVNYQDLLLIFFKNSFMETFPKKKKKKIQKLLGKQLNNLKLTIFLLDDCLFLSGQQNTPTFVGVSSKQNKPNFWGDFFFFLKIWKLSISLLIRHIFLNL